MNSAGPKVRSPSKLLNSVDSVVLHWPERKRMGTLSCQADTILGITLAAPGPFGGSLVFSGEASASGEGVGGRRTPSPRAGEDVSRTAPGRLEDDGNHLKKVNWPWSGVSLSSVVSSVLECPCLVWCLLSLSSSVASYVRMVQTLASLH